MTDEKHCSIAVHETRDNKLSRNEINEYISWIIKYSFVRPSKHSRMKIELTFDSVKWVLRRCGDLDKYIFDERDFKIILSKAGFPRGLVSPLYDSRFIVAHVSICKALPAELSNMILTFIPGTWNDDTQDDYQCRYCMHDFRSAVKLQDHLRTYVHQERIRRIASPTYMKGKLTLGDDIGWINPWLRSGLICKYSYSGSKRSLDVPARDTESHKLSRTTP